MAATQRQLPDYCYNLLLSDAAPHALHCTATEHVSSRHGRAAALEEEEEEEEEEEQQHQHLLAW